MTKQIKFEVSLLITTSQAALTSAYTVIYIYHTLTKNHVTFRPCQYFEIYIGGKLRD